MSCLRCCRRSERERERERKKGVNARTPPLCGYKESYLVPGGGLFTRFAPDICQRPPLTSSVWRSHSEPQINDCPLNCIIDPLMEPC